MKLSYTVENESIYLAEDGEPIFIIEEPAVLIDYHCGFIHKIGTREVVEAKHQETIKKDTFGIITKDLVLFIFDMDLWSKERVAEEMDKMLNISDYAGVFLRRLENNNMNVV